MKDSKRRELRVKSFGSWFRTVRESRGLTQRDIASVFDWSTAQFVSNWERGVSLPPSERLVELSSILRVPAKEIVGVIFDAKRAELEAEEAEALRAIKAHVRRAG